MTVLLPPGPPAPRPRRRTPVPVLLCRPMLFSADIVMAVLVVLLVARGLWDLFRE